MKSVIKLFLVVVLCSSAVFAEGEMGSSGRNCPNGTTTCLASTEPSEPTEPNETTNETEDSILTSVQEYLDWVFEMFENQSN